MDEEQALEMVMKFPWVPSGILPDNPKQLEPAAIMIKTGTLFVNALYAADYEIRKRR